MPGFDATGPRGEGPRTGRGLGRCGPAGSSPEREAAPDRPQNVPNDRWWSNRLGMAWRRGWGGGRGGFGGRGRGGGFGRGGGWGRAWFPQGPPPPEQSDREDK